MSTLAFNDDIQCKSAKFYIYTIVYHFFNKSQARPQWAIQQITKNNIFTSSSSDWTDGQGNSSGDDLRSSKNKPLLDSGSWLPCDRYHHLKILLVLKYTVIQDIETNQRAHLTPPQHWSSVWLLWRQLRQYWPDVEDEVLSDTIDGT